MNNKIHNSYFKLRNSSKFSGFTIIELLIVMTLIGGLVGIVVVKFPASQKRARDTQRKSDMKQYQTALESYASRNNGVYPLRDAANIKASDNAGNPSLCNDLGLNTTGNTDCPADSKDNQVKCTSSTCRYFYRSNGGVSTGVAGATIYVLWGALEQPVSVTNKYFVVCSNGKSSEGVAPTTSACPI